MHIRQFGISPFLCLVLIAAISQLAPPGSCQEQSKFQAGTIMAVRPHQQSATKTGSTAQNSSTGQYDIDVKVGNTLYTVLFTPPPGTYGQQFSAGLQLMVAVGAKTLTFNDMLGHSRNVPILSQKPVSASVHQ